MKYYVLFVIILFLLIVNSRLVSSCTWYIDGKCCNDNVWPPYCLRSGCCSSGTLYSASDPLCSFCDTAPPTYSSDNDDSGGSSTVGTMVNVSVLWEDWSSLNYSILRRNITGSEWENISSCSFSENPGWCNLTLIKPVEGDIGKMVCWNQWANDSLDNLNDSMPAHCFDVVETIDNVPPTYSSDNDDSKGSVTEGATVNVSVYWQDSTSNLGISNLYYVVSGSVNLISSCSFTSKFGWCNNTIETVGQGGKTVCWDEYANDTFGNLNDSMSNHCFNVVSSSETSSSSIESIFQSLREEISSSSAEFSVKVVTLSVEFLGIIILVILLVLVVQQLVQSH